MTTPANYTTLPISPDVFWPITGIVALALICLLIVKSMPSDEERKAEDPRGLDALMEQLGVSRGWVGPLLFGVLVLLTILGVSLFELARSYFFAEKLEAERFGIFASIVTAFIAGLFLAWRNIVFRKQATIQDQALFNDKINAASEDLAARRQVTRVVGRGAKMQVLNEWEDDLVTRAAAIDRLHGLAQERSSSTQRIARQLSIYVRELSMENKALDVPSGVEPAELKAWALGLLPLRSDIELAAQHLGALQGFTDHNVSEGDLDFREANLQGFDLSDAKFMGGIFTKTKFQGAFLYRANFSNAKLYDSEFQGAGLRNVNFDSADLYDVQFHASELSDASMKDADILGVSFDAQTDISGLTLRGAGIRRVDELTIQKLRNNWIEFFADGSVQLPDSEERPKHWVKEELGWDDFYTAWETWRETLPND